jgi:hypothetical protein
MLPSLGALHALRLNEDGIPTDTKMEEIWAKAKYGRDWGKTPGEREKRLREARKALAQVKQAERGRGGRAKVVQVRREEEESELLRAEKAARAELAAQAKAEKLRIAGPVFDEFPAGELFELDGLRELMRVPTLIEQTFQLSNWVFSAEEGSTVKGVRLDDRDGDMQSILRTLDVRFANKQSGNCGSYNCFEASVGTFGSDPVHTGLNKLISSLQQDIETSPMPPLVAVRAPKKSSRTEYSYDETRLGRDELALTLHMAATGIGPPILAAFPVRIKGHDDLIVIDDYAYVTENISTDFEDVLEGLGRTHRTPEDYRAAVDSISKSTVDLMRLVAANNIVLTDVKPGNMVTRRSGTSYQVKMIDFGAKFTSNVNMHAAEIGERTPEECIFFVNGLLLASYLTGSSVAHQHVLKQFVKEVVGTWKHMENTGMAGGFCFLLERDTVFPQDPLAKMRNLSMVPKDEFLSALRNAFYTTLEHYGDDDVLKPDQSKAPEGVNPSYISRLVDRIEAIYA